MNVRSTLNAIPDPSGKGTLISAGRILDLRVDASGKVRVLIDAREDAASQIDALLDELTDKIKALPGITEVQAILTRHDNTRQNNSQQPAQTSPAPEKAAPSASATLSDSKPRGGHDNPLGLKDFMTSRNAKAKRIEDSQNALEGVKKVIAIASGKGGVGKSTLTINLAMALAASGKKVGILDCDVYGPSLPVLLGLEDTGMPDVIDGKIQPIEAYGMKVMSIGLLVDSEKALAWRGPMVMGAVRQMINDVDWGTLDILLIDTPPGTGDAHLTLIQTGKLDGAVIVTTPQAMALADVRRGITLFEKTNVPLIGLVENMAWLTLPDGTKQYLFGQAGGEDIASTLKIPFLGAIPLEPAIGTANDQGEPFVHRQTDSAAKDAMTNIAEKLVM